MRCGARLWLGLAVSALGGCWVRLEVPADLPADLDAGDAAAGGADDDTQAGDPLPVPGDTVGGDLTGGDLASGDLAGDTTPLPIAPTAVVRIEGGAPFTRLDTVSLDLACVGCSEVYVTNDPGCASGGTWRAMLATLPWPLAQTNGLASVYVAPRNLQGLVGACARASILHDDVAPTPVVAVDDGEVWDSLATTPPAFALGGAQDGGSLLARIEFAVGTGADPTAIAPWSDDGVSPLLASLPATLVEGPRYVVSARAVDHAGNVSSVTVSDGFVVDVTQPALTIDAPSSGQPVATSALPVQGRCESDVAVAVSYGVNVAGPAGAACNAGNYRLDVDLTGPVGARSLSVSQIDAAGNGAAASVSFSYDTGIAPSLTRIDLLVGHNAYWGEHDGASADARFSGPLGMARAGNDLYVADRAGHTIRHVDLTTHVVTTIAGVAGTYGCDGGVGLGALLDWPSGLLLRGSDLYIADKECDLIFELDLATSVVTPVIGGIEGSADGVGTAARLDGPYGLASDGTNLYFTEYSGHRVRRADWSTLTVTTIAGSTGGVAGYTNATGTAARFSKPQGVVAAGGALYVADNENHAIRRIVGNVVTTYVGAPPPGNTGSDDGAGTAARFCMPALLDTDGTTLWVADYGNFAVRQVVLASAAVTTLAGGYDFGYRDGPVGSAMFDGIEGVLSAGTALYVAETYNSMIRRIDLPTATVATIAGNTSPLAGPQQHVDGVGTDAGLAVPAQMVLLGSTLYFAENQSSAVRSVSIPDGEVLTLAGGRGFGGADGGPAAARFAYPNALATDGVDLYVGDTDNCAIRRLDLGDSTTTTIAGALGTCGYVNATGAAARFGYIDALFYHAGRLYVGDDNCAVRVLDLSTMAVTTLSGPTTADNCGYNEGAAGAARFEEVRGITGDATNLYVSDSSNHVIRRVSLSTGATALVAGGGPGPYANGSGAAAAFDGPIGITAIGGGILLVADSANDAVRRIDVATGAVTTLIGDGTQSWELDGPLGQARLLEPTQILSTGYGVFVDSGHCNLRWIR